MILKIDHFVITTDNVPKCIEFYSGLGFSVKKTDEKVKIFAGDFKINIHQKGKEVVPQAKKPTVGSADFCFEVSGDLGELKKSLKEKGFKIELGIIKRVGSRGPMNSIYLRDYDGNLIELSSYQ